MKWDEGAPEEYIRASAIRSELSRTKAPPFVKSADEVGDIQRWIDSEATTRVVSRLVSWDLKKLKTELGVLDATRYKEFRAKRLVLHMALHEKGIAPVWRGDMRVSYSPGRKLADEVSRFFNDSQIFDLLWVHKTKPGTKVNKKMAPEFGDLFSKPDFSFVDAEIIATARLTRDRKVKVLMLPETTQEELIALRVPKVRKRIDRAEEAAHEASTLLFEAAQRNAHRGEKTRARIPEWTDIWLSLKLANGNVSEAARIFKTITGNQTTPHVVRRRRTDIERALKEVGGSHVKDMFPTAAA